MTIVIKKIDHLGIAVPSLAEAGAAFEALGLRVEAVHDVPTEKVKTAFLKVGESHLELLEPTDQGSVIARFLEKRSGLHHVCLAVEDIDAALAELKARGVRLIDETPRVGAGGCRVAFIHPKATAGVLMELKEPQRPEGGVSLEEKVMRELLRGKGAHADALACVEGVPPDVAGRRVPGFPQSIFGLVWHAAYWMDYELARTEGKAPPYPDHADASWPKDEAPRNAREWDETVNRFRAGLAALDALAADPGSAQRKVALTSQATNQGDTVKDIVWQTLVHNSYHLGQVVLLRQALRAWPPPSGTDTW